MRSIDKHRPSFSSAVSVLCIMVLSVTQFACATSHIHSLSQRGPASGPISEAQILTDYDFLLDPSVSPKKQTLYVDEIAKGLFDQPEGTREQTFLQFSQKLQATDLKALIEKYNVRDEDAHTYHSQLVERLSALGIQIDAQSSAEEVATMQKHAAIGAIIGAILGLTLAATGAGSLKEAFSNVNGAHNDIGSYMITFMAAATGAGLGAGEAALERCINSSKSLDDLKASIRDETEKLKQAQDTVEDLQ